MNRYERQYSGSFPILIVLFFTLFVVSVRFGAVGISWEEILNAVRKNLHLNAAQLTLKENIFLQIRLPRAILCIIAGASLAVAGALMQALFRNPIVEPGLIGTSSGAAFGAALYLVLGSTLHINGGEWSLSLAACIGGIVATLLVMVLTNKDENGKTSLVALLLTGIAINALFMSGVGFLSYIARDPQARSVTFWNLGTLSGANWNSVIVVGIVCIVCIYFSLRYAKALNTLMLGEDDAHFLGTNVAMLKKKILCINILLVAVTTAFVGVIGFVGLIAPHLMRILHGADNRYLITGSAVMGAIILTLADLVARLLLSPAELPIGIVTSVVGVPIFIILLRKGKHYIF